MKTLASTLEGTQGEQVALQDVTITATLNDLLTEVTVTQTYCNIEDVGIEAVYTFPLPLDAVLLELEVELGGRRLTGTVVAREVAEAEYEEAIESGDTAVMLELLEPGLYTMNVGNLLSGEVAEITLRYAMLHRWTGDRLRLLLPTTVAPRYGRTVHLPHQTPETSLTVDHQFALRVELEGALKDTRFACPSHPVSLDRSRDKVVLSLRETRAVMDRDFVLEIQAPRAERGAVVCGQDGDGTAALATFQPFFPGLREPRALSLAIVVDCSGSMAGDSIVQARQAVDGILERLRPDDRVTVLAFGSSTTLLSKRLLSCNTENLDTARLFVGGLEADLGGTEVREALREAAGTLRRVKDADLFLITDGEVSDWESIVEEAAQARHRIFTVGVGSAVSEPFVRNLASETGGACELVSPNEDMAERIVRHFERMRAPRARSVRVKWPDGAHDTSPSEIGAVFEGDTLIASASFARPNVRGEVVLEIETQSAELIRQRLALSASSPAQSGDRSTVARLAAAQRLNALEDEEARATALQYQLMSPWTHFLVVAQRNVGDKAVELPHLRKVPQTPAAGWSGLGHADPAGHVRAFSGLDVPAMWRSPKGDPKFAAIDIEAATFEIPSFLRSAPSSDKDAYDDKPQGPDSSLLILLMDEQPSQVSPANALKLLQRAGLAEHFEAVFRLAAELNINIEQIATIVLVGLMGTEADSRLSIDGQKALDALHQPAENAREAIRLLGRHGARLLRRIERGVADALALWN